MTKPFAWSYSALESFETCPRRHAETKIWKRFVEPQTEQLEWGNRVHKALENRLKTNTPLPSTMAEYEPLALTVVTRAVGGKLMAEQKMAINARFEPVTYFAKDCWARGITDFTVVKGTKAFIGDWKTGAPKPNSAQLKLTAAMTFHHLPYVTTVHNAFVWLKDGSVTKETFTRDDLPAIWSDFLPRVQRMEQAIKDEKFPPKPSGLCRKYCPVKTCEFHGQ